MMNAMARKAIEDEGHIYISISKVNFSARESIATIILRSPKNGMWDWDGKKRAPEKEARGGEGFQEVSEDVGVFGWVGILLGVIPY